MKPNDIKPATPRDELLDLLWAKYPKGWFKTSEQFNGAEGGIWTGENSMMDDGTPMFDYYSFGYLNKPGTVKIGGATTPVDGDNRFSGTATVAMGTNNIPVVATNLNGNATTNTYNVTIPTSTAVTPTYEPGTGNMATNGTGQTYTWDAKNQLTKIAYTGGATTEMTYDGQGRRVMIVEKDNSGAVTSTKQFVWRGNTIIQERNASNAVARRFFAQGEVFSGNKYFYTRDHLGSVREMSDNSGVLKARYDYDPWGRVTTVGTVTAESDFKYAGYYWQTTSSLSLTKYRAYDANMGRWLSRDPIAEAGGINIYDYVLNDPINGIDRLGLDIEFSGTRREQEYIKNAIQELAAASFNNSRQNGGSGDNNTTSVNDLITALYNSKTKFYIGIVHNKGPDGNHQACSTATWDPDAFGVDHNANFAQLAHELQHLWDFDRGIDPQRVWETNGTLIRAKPLEERAVRRENQAISDLNKK